MKRTKMRAVADEWEPPMMKVIIGDDEYRVADLRDKPERIIGLVTEAVLHLCGTGEREYAFGDGISAEDAKAAADAMLEISANKATADGRAVRTRLFTSTSWTEHDGYGKELTVRSEPGTARIAHAYWEGLEDKKCLTLQGLMLYMIEEKTKATAAQEAE